MAYGSRFLGRASGGPAEDHLANRLLTWMTNVLFGARLTDMETCYKVMRPTSPAPCGSKRTGSTSSRKSRPSCFGPDTGSSRPRPLPTAIARRRKKIGWRDGIAAIATLWRLRRTTAASTPP